MKNKTVTAFLSILIAGFLVACNNANTPNNENSNPTTSANHNEEDHDHEHDEAALGTHDIDGIKVEASQGHGHVEPGKEGVAVGVTEKLTNRIDSIKIVKEISKILGGKGGGGRKDFAQAGSQNLGELKNVHNFLQKKMKTM